MENSHSHFKPRVSLFHQNSCNLFYFNSKTINFHLNLINSGFIRQSFGEVNFWQIVKYLQLQNITLLMMIIFDVAYILRKKYQLRKTRILWYFSDTLQRFSARRIFFLIRYMETFMEDFFILFYFGMSFCSAVKSVFVGRNILNLVIVLSSFSIFYLSNVILARF